MGGAQPPEPEEERSGEDPLAQLLQGLMGGQQSQAGASEAEPQPALGGMDLGGLLGGLLGGGGGLLLGGFAQALTHKSKNFNENSYI